MNFPGFHVHLVIPFLEQDDIPYFVVFIQDHLEGAGPYPGQGLVVENDRSLDVVDAPGMGSLVILYSSRQPSQNGPEQSRHVRAEQ